MSSPNGALFAALSVAQSALRNVGFDKTNPHFKNRYASLAAVRDAVTPALADNGLSLMQFPTSAVVDGKPYVGCRTILAHKDGGYIEDSFTLPLVKPAPQDGGSALTYARRYALLAVLNLVGDDDDDATEASRPTATTRPVAAKQDVKQSPGLRAVDAVTKWSGLPSDDALALTKKIVAQLNIKVAGGKMTDAQADEIVAFVEANKDKDFTKVVK